MTRRRTTLVGAALAVVAASLALAACGGSSSSSDSTQATTTAATTTATTTAKPVAKTTVVPVVLGSPNEFSLVPAKTSVPAGKVTFTVVNKGSMEHEMVVVPSPNGPASLKEADGSASEAGSLGEVADLKAGATGRLTVTMPAGQYTLLCNLPGHFAGGMYATFTVT